MCTDPTPTGLVRGLQKDEGRYSMLKRCAGLVVVSLLVALTGAAQGMMGGGSVMPNGTGMAVVAADGSLLVTQMGMSMMGGPGTGGASLQRAIVSLGTNGMERWRFTVTQGWPMAAASNGDLVVVVVMNNAWM